MILRTLKSNHPVNLIIFPVIGLLFWFRSLMSPFVYPFFIGENENLLYVPINKINIESDTIQVLLSLILVVFIAFLIQQINDRYAFIRARTKLPAAVFVIIIAGFTIMHTLHPVYFAAIFLLFAIYSLFAIFNNPGSFSEIFNAGMFIGIGALFYFSLIIIFPAFLIGIIILYREVRWRQFVILFLGLITPFIFALSYVFYFDQILEFLYTLERSIVTPVNHFKNNYALYAFLSFLIILTIIGSIKLLQQYDSRKVSSRKYYSVFLVIFLFSMIGFAFIPATSQEMLIIAVIPLTFLISNLLVSLESRFWGEFLFLILITTVILMQFSDQFLQ